MKTGLIIYITNADNILDDFEIDKAVKRLNLNVDMIEVVSGKIGHFDVMDAWRTLFVKGMKHIICDIAHVINDSELKLTGREVVIVWVYYF